jgi:hypothetical protein
MRFDVHNPRLDSIFTLKLNMNRYWTFFGLSVTDMLCDIVFETVYLIHYDEI